MTLPTKTSSCAARTCADVAETVFQQHREAGVLRTDQTFRSRQRKRSW